MSATADSPDLDALRARLVGGDRIWRSLDEAADNPEFRRWLDAEFPSLSGLAARGPDRRTVLKVMAAALGLSGLAACRPDERILPYVVQPERTTPGVPRLYATTLSSEGWGMGVVVETREGRPIKIEGNPDHPASRGATDAVMQAAVLSLYDPERVRAPRFLGEPATWGAWQAEMAALRARFLSSGGAGLALLIEPTTSPTLGRLIEALRREYPALRLFEHAPLGRDPVPEAARRLWGRPLSAVWRLDRARRIFTLDADILTEGPGRLALARDFIARRRVRGPGDGMSRLWAVESTPTITGAKADERRAVRPSEVARIGRGLLAVVEGGEMPSDVPEADWLRRAARDLMAAGPEALVIPGLQQPPEVAETALRLNARLGSLGRAVEVVETVLPELAEGDVSALAEAIDAGEVTHLLSLAPDPVGTASAGLDLGAALQRLESLHHWSLYPNATAPFAQWLLPAAHDLESWGDLRAFDGTASLQQPMIEPLYDGRPALEVLSALGGRYDLSALEILRENWAGLDDRAWAGALQKGVVEGSASAPVAVPSPAPASPPMDPQPSEGMEARFVPDPFLRDGRHANNAWLQELPRPITKIVWGNAALFSPRTAGELGLSNDDEALLRLGGHEQRARVWIVPGHPDGTVTLPLGYGQGQGSVAGVATGYDAFRLRPAGVWFAGGLEVEWAGVSGTRVLTTQQHGTMEEREIVRRASLAEFRADPHLGIPSPPEGTLYPDWDYPRESWGMSVDLTACIGCMACVAACQSENNIPTVGPFEVELGHEMHWLRVDRYYTGTLDEPETLFQPVPCMHCEKAPCEAVCPVNATVHTHDGLNAQVYNRCVGTRYCSQNCPYKVRRFNFRKYTDFTLPDPQADRRNPEVTVRSRGVMEKCTYCIQRISAARIRAQIENRPIADGEVTTACAQACPTEAITFGNMNDPQARVVAEKAAPHDYTLLAELNTRPHTTYLARISNPAGEDGDG